MGIASPFSPFTGPSRGLSDSVLHKLMVSTDNTPNTPRRAKPKELKELKELKDRNEKENAASIMWSPGEGPSYLKPAPSPPEPRRLRRSAPATGGKGPPRSCR